MDFSLRLLINEDVPALQRVYDACPDQLRHLIGQPARPEQAARDFVEGLQAPGRYQFGVFIDDAVVGMVDCKLDETVKGLETSFPRTLSEAVGFWEWAGFAFTGEQYRRDLPGYNPRLLAMGKALSSAS